MAMEERLRAVRAGVRCFPDFPVPGVLFRDISPLLKDPVAFRALIDLLEDHLRTSLPPIDFIAGGCSPGQSTVCRCCPGGRCGETPPRGARRYRSPWVSSELQPVA
uniref:adenine phosphoribosyltransferase n=1 Tax=Anas platyrhynchos platyrhynchos TaxID=8840 RepID=A0A493SWG4_ANAPP